MEGFLKHRVSGLRADGAVEFQDSSGTGRLAMKPKTARACLDGSEVFFQVAFVPHQSHSLFVSLGFSLCLSKSLMICLSVYLSTLFPPSLCLSLPSSSSGN